MPFLKECMTITSIKNDVNDIKNRLDEFSYEIDTEEVTAALSQVKKLLNSCIAVQKHLAGLVTQEEKDNYVLKESALKVCKLFDSSNFIEMTALSLSNVTDNDLVSFQKYFNVTLVPEGYGTWRWLYVYKDGERTTVEDLYDLGIKERKECTRLEKVEEEKTKYAEGTTVSGYYGWLSPSADFIVSDFGTHEESATMILDKLGATREEYRTAVDTLLDRGYCLLHNPTGYGGVLLHCSDRKNLTKKQKDFLYQYFSDIKDWYMANQFME